MRNLPLLWLLLMLFSANSFCIDIVLASGQCQSDQLSLLLQIRSSLVFNLTQSVNLSRWNQSTDCCNWGGVQCDEGGRIVGLNLSNESISSGIENASGLFSLQYLQSLNLAFNKFKATQIPSRLANLTNLTYLNLSNAGFAGQIPIEISNMTTLVTLDLSASSFLVTSLLKLENPNLSLLIQNLTKLRELYLDGVNISVPGNEWCKALSSLPHLQVLSMSNCFLSGPIDSSLGSLRSLSVIRLDQNNLSSTVPDIFADFSNLTSLHLSGCRLHGKFPEKIFQVPKLETLELTENKFLEGFLPDISKNISLQTLKLSNTNFSGTLPDSIGNLKNLSRLELGSCNFTGPIPASIANLTKLVYVDLSFNNFTGPVPSFHMCKTLSYLDLSHNGLTGAISSTGWEQLSNLVYVDLYSNSLSGRIPPSLFAITSLEKLLLANNQFEGQVPDFPYATSSVLDSLDLSGNKLEGPIPKSIFELEKLNVLLLSSNRFNGTVQLDKIRLSNLTKLDLSYNNLSVRASSKNSFLPKISTLRLASCNLKAFPNVQNHTKLTVLDLSNNQISGKIPDWIGQVGNGSLTNLNLSHNYLVGLQEPQSVSGSNLFVLDLHSNHLQGEIPHPPLTAAHVDYSSNNFTSIPADIGYNLSYTIYFSLSNNSLTGALPVSICDATNLLVLDLSNNKLSGTIPKCLIKMSGTLGVLNLRRNGLNGTVFDTFPGTCGLQTLDLNGNHLEGGVPESLAKCQNLEVLDLGNNKINDTFPSWLKNISSLRVLVLRSNQFYGDITCTENNSSWPMLQIVDLASNKFSGRLPQKCLKNWKAMMVDEDEAQSKLKHLRFEFLKLSNLYYQDTVTVTSKGLEMELVKILNIFTSIDLSCNNFQGPIPEEMGQFKSLYVLNLSHNALTGQIPSSMGKLRQLESLDLSVNILSGMIPSQLAKLNFLSVLNLSSNQLVGMIPLGTQLQSFSASSFEGNKGLCGSPLPNECASSSNLQPSATAPSEEFDWQLIVTGVGFGIGSAAVIAPLMFCNKVNDWYDDGIDKFLMVVLPMVGLTYITSHERKVEAEENLEDEITNDDEEKAETEDFPGRYCVFCSKLDITRKRVVHELNCTCHQSSPISSSSSTSSSCSSSAI